MLPIEQNNNMPVEERRIREFLAQARWRKARDEAKAFLKSDRVRYLPLVIEANTGLAREMLAKGQNSEASQVVAYLKTIASKEIWQALEAEIAEARGDFSGIAAHNARLLAQPNAVLSEHEQRRLTDSLVVAFESKPVGDGLRDMAIELEAIQNALRYVSEERFNMAAESLRPICAHSIFRHWKLFIKGLAAFHQGDREKALRLLTGLPADSVVARAAEPYIYWLDPKGNRLKDASEPTRQLLARFSASDQSAPTLLKAEHLWLEDNPEGMYSLLRRSIGEFPSERSDWVGALSAFSLNCLAGLHWEAAEPYVSFLENLECSTRSDTERKMLLRVISLHFASADPLFLLEKWDQYLRLRDRIDGPNNQLSSIAYEWLGGVLLGFDRQKPWDPLSGLGPLRNTPRVKAALDSLKKSVELDAGNLNAQLMLVQFYDRLKQHGPRNRLLDQMTVRFPQNKHVLLLAGTRCLDRKAYVKGLAYFNQALEHDRLDPVIPERIVVAQSLYALEQYRRGRAADARKTLDASAGFMVDRQNDIVRSRWSMLLRRSVLEQMYGNQEDAAKLLNSARTAGPGEEAILFLGHILTLRYAQTPNVPDPFFAKFKAGLGSATAGRAMLLFHIFNFWEKHRLTNILQRAKLLLREYLQAAAKHPFSREEARTLLENIPPTGSFYDERRLFIKPILKKDRRDPLFRLFEYIEKPVRFVNIESQRRKLQEFMKEAVVRKDDDAMQRIGRELQKLDSPMPDPLPDIYDFPDVEDFEDFEDECDFGSKDDLSIEELVDQMIQSFPRHEFEELVVMLNNASESEMRKIRKTKPKEIPQFIFDQFLETIRNRSGKIDLESDTRGRSSQRKKSQRSLF